MEERKSERGLKVMTAALQMMVRLGGTLNRKILIGLVCFTLVFILVVYQKASVVIRYAEAPVLSELAGDIIPYVYKTNVSGLQASSADKLGNSKDKGGASNVSSTDVLGSLNVKASVSTTAGNDNIRRVATSGVFSKALGDIDGVIKDDVRDYSITNIASLINALTSEIASRNASKIDAHGFKSLRLNTSALETLNTAQRSENNVYNVSKKDVSPSKHPTKVHGVKIAPLNDTAVDQPRLKPSAAVAAIRTTSGKDTNKLRPSRDVQGVSKDVASNISAPVAPKVVRNVGNINTRAFQYVIKPSVTCRGRQVELIICVPVSRSDFAGRQVVRETWGSFASTVKFSKEVTNATVHRSNSNRTVIQDEVENKNSNSSSTTEGPIVLLVFFIGSSSSPSSLAEQADVEKEAEIYGDILQENYIDSYENLTLKSMSILKWVTTQCPNARYVAKIDGDMYVNIPLLIEALQHYTNTLSHSSKGVSVTPEPFVVGSLIRKAMPIRSNASKWYTTKQEYNQKFYPNYVSGTTYAMSGSAAAKIYQASGRVPLFWLEDIYITGMCRQESKVKLIGDSRFSFYKPKAKGCTFRKHISGHQYKPHEIRKIHKELSNPATRC